MTPTPPDPLGETPPPHSIEAEQQVLGAILTSNDVLARLDLDPGDFYDPVHARIFELARARIEAGLIASPVTLKPRLAADEGLAQLGGPAYLARLALAAISSHAAKDYAALIREARQARDMLAAAEAAARAIRDGKGPREAQAIMEQASMALAAGAGRAGPVSWLRATTDLIAETNDAYQGVEIPGVPTGIAELDAFLGVMRPGYLTILGGRPAMGKAQPLDAKVLLASGEWRAMGDLRVGDRLASVDGAPSLVAGIYPQGRRKVYRVTFSDGRSTRACGEHLWHVESCRFGGARVISTKEMGRLHAMTRYRKRLRIPLMSGRFGSDEALPLDPWVLGALIGNGNLTRAATVRFSTADEETLARLEALLGQGQRVSAGGGYDYRLCGIGGGRNALLDTLRRMGLMGRRAEEKRIPPVYLRATRAARVRLLQGLMDTDGWVEAFGSVRYSTSSPGLAEDVCALVRSLGGVCTIRTKQPHAVKGAERKPGLLHYVLNIRHDSAEEFVALRRKQERIGRKKPVALTLASIEEVGEEAVQCIAVTHPSRLYLTDDFIVTHNTGIALSIAARAAKAGHPVIFASLEMMPQGLAVRGLTEEMAQGGINLPYADALRGQMSEDEFRALIETTKALEALPIWFLPRQYGELSAMRAGLRQCLMRAKGLAKVPLLVVDYLQLMDVAGVSRFEKVTAISQGLKAIAMTEGLPVLALSQLSRAVENREDKRPNLADLRESGQLEQDADQVLFAFREEYYLARAEPDPSDTDAHLAWQASMEAVRGRLEIIVAKQRQGRTGTARVRFAPATNRIWGDAA